MGDEANGNQNNRLDRIERIVEVLVNDRVQFRDEHRQLLKAQVLLYDNVQKLGDNVLKLGDNVQMLSDSVQKIVEAQATVDQRLATLAAAQAQLATAQQHTDEKLAALIDIVDSLIRRPPPQ